MSEKKKYEIKHNKYYDLTIVCRYDIMFEAAGSETLDTVFDFVVNTINHHYSIARTSTNNSTGYNLPFFNPNIFVLSFNHPTVPTEWFRPQDVFINSFPWKKNIILKKHYPIISGFCDGHTIHRDLS